MYVTTVVLKEVDRHTREQYPMPYRMKHASMSDLKAWVAFNNMVLGTPLENTPYFSVEHADGSPLSEEELARLVPTCSVEAYQSRMPPMMRHQTPVDGAVHAIIAKILTGNK